MNTSFIKSMKCEHLNFIRTNKDLLCELNGLQNVECNSASCGESTM